MKVHLKIISSMGMEFWSLRMGIDIRVIFMKDCTMEMEFIRVGRMVYTRGNFRMEFIMVKGRIFGENRCYSVVSIVMV